MGSLEVEEQDRWVRLDEVDRGRRVMGSLPRVPERARSSIDIVL